MPRPRFLNYRSPLRPASLPPSGLALHSPQANQTQSLPSPAASKPKGCRSVQSAANPSAHGLPPNPTRQGLGGALRPISGPRRATRAAAASKPKGCRSVQSAANPSAHGLPPNPTRQGLGGALRPISGPRRATRAAAENTHICVICPVAVIRPL